MIYLDNASTTKIAGQVQSKIDKISNIFYANPNSSHQGGTKARKLLEDSRKKIADFLKCSPEELIFTSGGTESNNLALKGLAKALVANNPEEKIELITTEIEHKSILETATDLKNFYGIEISHLKPNSDGLIEADRLTEMISDKTRLVSVMFVNNETGVVQPIEKIGRIIKEINQKRPKTKQIYFHTDAVQALGYLNIDLSKINIDLLSISAHKIHGPKGVGLLYFKKRTPLKAILSGGGQESGLRSGTQNVPGIVGLAEAINLIDKEDKNKVGKLRKYFERKLKEKLPDIKINSESRPRSPHISSIIFPDAEGESILLALDLEGIAVSTGSACNAKDLKASHVLRAINLTAGEAQSTVRFSFSKYNTKKEIDTVIEKLSLIIPKLQSISPKNN
jgi:cysteine desulfurase